VLHLLQPCCAAPQADLARDFSLALTATGIAHLSVAVLRLRFCLFQRVWLERALRNGHSVCRRRHGVITGREPAIT
jgi:hypothetical protein